MREVAYAGGSFLTGDEIADVLLEYAAELANADRAATVHIPSIDAGGEVRDVVIVIGPASQVLSEPVHSAVDDPDAGDFVTEVTERINQLRRSPVSPADPSSVDWDL
jgi:hypothetical protein